jgi:hypothetical protein
MHRTLGRLKPPEDDNDIGERQIMSTNVVAPWKSGALAPRKSLIEDHAALKASLPQTATPAMIREICKNPRESAAKRSLAALWDDGARLRRLANAVTSP